MSQPVAIFAQPRGAGRLPPRLQRLMELEEQQRQEQSPTGPQATAPPEVDGLPGWLKRFHDLIPLSAEEFAKFDPVALREATDAIDQWCVLWGRVAAQQPTDEKLAIVGRLVDAQQLASRQLDDLLLVRGDFVALPADAKRHAALRGYLQAAAVLVDLSGRLRYSLGDTIDDVAGSLSDRLGARERLIDLLDKKQSSIGAEIMSAELFDPAADSEPATTAPKPAINIAAPAPEASQRPLLARRLAIARMEMQAKQVGSQARLQSPPDAAKTTAPLSAAQKLKLIHLIATSGSIEMVPDLADLVLDDSASPTVVLAAAEAIRTLGLPQDSRAGQDETLPEPSITAAKLRERLLRIDRGHWTADERRRADELSAWLAGRAEHGLEGETYRLGQFEVQPGDWLLMRNPSPYNLFTDLAPGLFTHVGVVALQTGSDGKRRMVVVDLPERGTSMPATNVEIFIQRTLNYVFLRHPDPETAKKMGQAAASMIGNPTEFDLNFRTDRVAEFKGKPLAGQKIHTYCAGLLLVCAQETSVAREAFFPITETAAGGHTKDNIAKLGLSLGSGFVSPTGALFSTQLKIVGRNEPLYEPRREVEEAIYDYFAQSLEKKDLRPSPDLFQSLRQKMAEASKSNVILAQALSATAGVSPAVDLVSAAKAQAVVETLDDIAFGASREFQIARRAIMDVPDLTPDERAKLKLEERDALDKYRARHADLAARWDSRQVSPRALRIELVRYYADQGRRQLDARFFGGEK
jgi:hypothetical protein